MQINMDSSISQTTSSANTNTKTTSALSFQDEMQQASSSNSVASVEEVEKTGYTEEEIAKFLKDKPYTAFRYEFNQKYAPDKGISEITDLMDRYYHKKVQESQYEFEMNANYEALEKGLDTLEKYKAQLQKEMAAQKGLAINRALSNLSDALKYQEDYGIDVQSSYFTDCFLNMYLHFYSSLMYQDRKADENGQIYILPKDSDEWVTREEFIEMCPDYELYESIDRTPQSEIYLVKAQGEEAVKKYAEKYFANLSEEEIKMLYDGDLFADPGLQTLGMECLEQFAKDLDDIKHAKVNKWTGLNEKRARLLRQADEVKRQVAKYLSEGTHNVALFTVIPYSSSTHEQVKLIAELGLSDYIKIDTRQVKNGLINGYKFDENLVNQYSECFYIPERDEASYGMYDLTRSQLDRAIQMYGSVKNVERAYLYAINNNLSLDILSNNYFPIIGKENAVFLNGKPYTKIDNLNGRDDFLTALFSPKESETKDDNIQLTLELKSKYLSKLQDIKNSNIDIILDIV